MADKDKKKSVKRGKKIITFLNDHLIVFKDTEALIGEKARSAEPYEYPFVASIGLKNPVNRQENNHFCGGSLITRIHVLTAAHCVSRRSANQLDVIIGEIDLRSASFRYDVDSFILYNDWARELGKSLEFERNDIAIITLSVSVDRPGINPVILTPLKNKQLHRINAAIVGWGIANNGSVADILQKAKVTILTPEECLRKVKLITSKIFILGTNYLCTSADPYALASCADSGGPLLDKGNDLVAVLRGRCPKDEDQWGDFSTEFLNQYKVNRHLSIDYYREFINNVTSLVTRP